MIDGALYVTTPYNNLAALDAESGKSCEIRRPCRGAPAPVLSGSGWKLRGTAFWRDGANLRMLLKTGTGCSRWMRVRAAGGVVWQRRRGVADRWLAQDWDITHATQSSPPLSIAT